MPDNTSMFMISPSQVLASAEQLKDYKSKLDSIADTITGYEARLKATHGAISNVSEVMGAIRENVIYNGKRVEQVGSVAQWCAMRYSNAEKTICGQPPSELAAAPGSIGKPPAIPDLKGSTKADTDKKEDLEKKRKSVNDYYEEKIGWNGDWSRTAKRTWASRRIEDGNTTYSYNQRETDTAIRFLEPTKRKAALDSELGEFETGINRGAQDFLRDTGLGKQYRSVSEKGPDGKYHPVDAVNDNNRFSRDLMGVDIARAEASASWTLDRSEAKAKGALGEAAASIAFLSAGASAAAGLGVYLVEKDGKKYVSAGLNAEAKANFTAVEGKASSEFHWQPGKELFGEDFQVAGAKVGGDLKALHAEAGAGVKCRLFDGKPEVAVNASAGAYALKGTVDGSATVLGITAGAHAEANIGVGATLNFGYTGGKLRCELGASLGLGFKVGFDLDISGAVSGAKNLISNAVKYSTAVKSVAYSALDSAGSALKKGLDFLTSW